MSCLREIAFSQLTDVIETNCPNISRSETVSKAISVLYSSESYEALVINGEFAGIVTVRDTLRVANPERTSVARIMFKPPNMPANAPLYEAVLALMDNRIRIIPITEDGAVTGVIRQTTILDRMVDCPDLKEFTAEDLMIKDPVTVDFASSAAFVRNTMLNKGISHAPVVDQAGNLKGIITAKDLVWNFFKPRGRVTVGERKGKKERLLNVNIKGVIDKHPLDASRRTPISQVIRDMVSLNKSYCIVVEKRKPIGIITPRDIISLLAEFKPRIQIPLYIFGFKNEDEAQIELAKRKIERAATRGLKMHPDLLEIVVHGKISASEGNKQRYTVNARAITPKETLAVNATGWSLLDVFDKISDKLDKRLKQVKAISKGKNIGRRKLANQRILS